MQEKPNQNKIARINGWGNCRKLRNRRDRRRLKFLYEIAWIKRIGRSSDSSGEQASQIEVQNKIKHNSVQQPRLKRRQAYQHDGVPTIQQSIFCRVWPP